MSVLGTDRAQGWSEAAPKLIDAKSAAELLSVPSTWVEQEARAGRLPSVSMGRYRRYEPHLLQAWWEGRREGPAPAASRGPATKPHNTGVSGQ